MAADATQGQPEFPAVVGLETAAPMAVPEEAPLRRLQIEGTLVMLIAEDEQREVRVRPEIEGGAGKKPDEN